MKVLIIVTSVFFLNSCITPGLRCMRYHKSYSKGWHRCVQLERLTEAIDTGIRDLQFMQMRQKTNVYGY